MNWIRWFSYDWCEWRCSFAFSFEFRWKTSVGGMWKEWRVWGDEGGMMVGSNTARSLQWSFLFYTCPLCHCACVPLSCVQPHGRHHLKCLAMSTRSTRLWVMVIINKGGDLTGLQSHEWTHFNESKPEFVFRCLGVQQLCAFMLVDAVRPSWLLGRWGPWSQNRRHLSVFTFRW